MLGTRYSGAALAKVRGRGLDRGWIVVLLGVFFFRELLFYCAVARLQCRDGVSRPHDGDGLSGSLPVLATCGWGRPLCYLSGCGLNVSRTLGAVQAPSSGVGGRRAGGPALRIPAPPRPAGRRCQPPAASVGGRRGWEAGVGATRGSPPARPGPARRGMAGGAARPPRTSPLAGAVPLCPRARRSPLPRRAGRGGRGWGGTAGAGAGAGACASAGRLRGPASAPRLALARASPVR